MRDNIEWTHKNIKIVDIRRLNKLYVLGIDQDLDGDGVIKPLFVNKKIFEEILSSYFIKDAYKITREEILSVKWNMFLSKGYYVKIDEKQNNVETFHRDKNKWFVSYIEIAGPLQQYFSSFKEESEDKEN